MSSVGETLSRKCINIHVVKSLVLEFSSFALRWDTVVPKYAFRKRLKIVNLFSFSFRNAFMYIYMIACPQQIAHIQYICVKQTYGEDA